MENGVAISTWVYGVSERLKKKLPKSEQWFWGKWKETPFYSSYDMGNEPFLEFIPDVINHKYKYVIEVNGSVHKRKLQSKRDGWKKVMYKKHGYKPFYITAFSEESFSAFLANMEAYRKGLSGARPKTILRRTK